MRVNTRLVASTRSSLFQPAGKLSSQSRGWGWSGSQHLHSRASHSLLAYLPPKTCVQGGPSAEDAPGDLIHVGTNDARRVIPNPVAKAGNVEPCEGLVLQPLGLHVSAPSGRRWGPLLNEKHLVAGPGQALGHGDSAGARSDDDVIKGLVFVDSRTSCVYRWLRGIGFNRFF